ncbi:hypothetical protein MSAN_00472400 [Mycena sanguinolenta]|uniref:Uncharacterized protein n=1 Tax=Mycena sanguinolenta TaxID=230812 RepID=A0A8H6ZB48_9AGAR|nr:hypothetical protein MSAN_00472400 [Mycena sanguinolenta]
MFLLALGLTRAPAWLAGVDAAERDPSSHSDVDAEAGEQQNPNPHSTSSLNPTPNPNATARSPQGLNPNTNTNPDATTNSNPILNFSNTRPNTKMNSNSDTNTNIKDPNGARNTDSKPMNSNGINADLMPKLDPSIEALIAQSRASRLATLARVRTLVAADPFHSSGNTPDPPP